MQLSQKWKILSNFFLHFVNVDLILNIFREKMTLMANVFFKLRAVKDVVR